MIRTILQDGDPILRKIAPPVTIFTYALADLERDMIETMRRAKGIGLAAPQIGVSTRIIVVEVQGQAWTMCNPVITDKRGTQRTTEGCLSVPRNRWYEPLTRALLIRVEYQDLYGERRHLKARALLAACVQHEIDHLDGVLFTDRIAGRIPVGATGDA